MKKIMSVLPGLFLVVAIAGWMGNASAVKAADVESKPCFATETTIKIPVDQDEGDWVEPNLVLHDGDSFLAGSWTSNVKVHFSSSQLFEAANTTLVDDEVEHTWTIRSAWYGYVTISANNPDVEVDISVLADPGSVIVLKTFQECYSKPSTR